MWLWMAACATLEVPLPELTLSTDRLDFAADAGGWASATFDVTNSASPGAEAAPYSPALAFGDGTDPGISASGGPFCLHWDTPACATVVAAASGTASLCADGVAEGGDTLALPAGCSLPVEVVYAPTAAGEHLAAARVKSAFGPWSTTGSPEVWEQSGDPTEPVQEVALYGTAAPAPASGLVLNPPLSSLPWAWPDGSTGEATLTLSNAGTADLRLGAPDLGCSVAWSLGDDAPSQGDVLAAGASTTFTVHHTPTEPDAEVCTLGFADDDATTSAAAELRFVPDGWGLPPTVAIEAPLAGTIVASDERTTVSFTLSDDEAPPSGILITIWSTATRTTLAQGVAPDDSGRVDFELLRGDLVPGPETLRVSLLDWRGFTTFDAVSFRVDTEPALDEDGDNWSIDEGDCDDGNAQAFPGAVETADGIDEDCDGTIDDGAPPLDNDGDDYTEADGDCNDHDGTVFPGAEETANNVDDNCDGAVDEGTLRQDGDGDGYTILVGDCDDTNPDIHPSAPEACDGVDHDCDGAPLACAPALAGAFLRISPDVCHPGESLTFTAVIPAPAPTLAWTVDRGTVADDAAAETSFKCPDTEGTVQVALGAADEAGNQVFDTSAVEVVAADKDLGQTVVLSK